MTTIKNETFLFALTKKNGNTVSLRIVAKDLEEAARIAAETRHEQNAQAVELVRWGA